MGAEAGAGLVLDGLALHLRSGYAVLGLEGGRFLLYSPSGRRPASAATCAAAAAWSGFDRSSEKKAGVL